MKLIKSIIIIIFASIIFLIMTCINTYPERANSFEILGYNNEDINLLKNKFTDAEIRFIINNRIMKRKLFPYLELSYFSLTEIHAYESIRIKQNVSHLTAVNLKNHPHIMDNFYLKINNALNLQQNLILVNKNYRLSADYIPDNLVYTKDIPLLIDDKNRYYLQIDVYNALKALFTEALKHNLTLILSNGYRSYEKQAKIYEFYKINALNADAFSARAGHSEHQTGLALDLTSESASYLLTKEFENTKEGIFIKDHAHYFGFIVRYPKDKSHLTGYDYEPWHLRYVGIEVAKIIFEKKLTLEEYLLYYTEMPLT